MRVMNSELLDLIFLDPRAIRTAIVPRRSNEWNGGAADGEPTMCAAIDVSGLVHCYFPRPTTLSAEPHLTNIW